MPTCEFTEATMSEVVVSKLENVAIISFGQTLTDFQNTNGTNWFLDIAKGVYPKMFKHFVEEYRAEKKD